MPTSRGRRVRPARRCSGAAAGERDPLRQHPHHQPVGAVGQPHLDRVDGPRAVDHAGEPGRACCTATTTASRRSGGATASSGRLLVANRPEDAAIIEARRRNGRGLLADDGVSISNLFSGDAATSLLTMSGLLKERAGARPVVSRTPPSSPTRPASCAAVIMTFGEMVKEVFQARRQVRRAVEPRIDRGGSYVALRAVTNVLLRDLNVALVVEAMMKGSRAIYVDFVDYDEIAHHAGVTRPSRSPRSTAWTTCCAASSRSSTAGITPRPYHLVLVSDHGQSQGATFLPALRRLARGAHPRLLRRRRDGRRRRPARSRPGAR